MKTTEQRLAEAEARVAQLAASADSHSAALTAKDARITELEAAATDATSKLTASAAQLADLTAKLTASEGEVAKLKAEAKTAEQIAAGIVAKSGVQPVSSTPAGTASAQDADFKAMSGKELAAHYAKLKGDEKEKFYAAHIAPRIS